MSAIFTRYHSHIKMRIRIFVLAVGCLSWLLCPATQADDDPFQIDTANWMSSEHYKEALERGEITTPIPKPETPDSQTTSGTASAPPTTVTPAAPPPLSSLIDLPPAPAMNKGYSVQISSTEDDHAISQPATSSNTPVGSLSGIKWKPVTANDQSSKVFDDDDEPLQPLNIRMSYLPAQSPTHTPGLDHQSAQKSGHDILRKSLAKNELVQEKNSIGTGAVCAAMNAYKKQQLTAIQSDRQTLQALQEAIHTLGLEKQLDFMTGNKLPPGDQSSSANANNGSDHSSFR